MKVKLIFPPDWNFLWAPHNGVPSLKAYLKEGGVESDQYDFNIEAYLGLLRKEPLIELWNKINWNADVPTETPETPTRVEIKKALSKKIEKIAGGIEDAISVFRSEDRFYSVEDYSRAIEIFDGAMSLISAAGMEMSDALKSPSAAMEAALNPAVNIFLPYLEKLVEKAIGKETKLVCVNVAVQRQLGPAIAIAALIKKKRPDIHVSLGGDYPTMIASAMENSPELFKVFDSLVVSEGEVATLGLAKAVESGEKIGDVPGILYAEGDKVVQSSLPVMEDADTLPTPDFDQMPLDNYLSPEPVLPIFSSRGCYWRRCVFCVRPDRKTFSQRSPQQVVKDVTYLKRRYKTRAFYFYDHAIRPRRMAEIADAFGEADLEVNWAASTRFGSEMSWDWCDQVAAGGCARIMLDVESASKRIVDVMDKGYRVEDVPQILQGLSKAGVDVTLYFEAGFPTEKTDEARKTLQFVERHQDTFTPYSQYHLNLFGIPLGSMISAEPAKFGVSKIPERAANDLRAPISYDFDSTDGMNRKEAVAVYKELNEKFLKLARKPFRMPHDMLIRLKESQETSPKAADAKMLKMNAILKLADDLRVEKGYLVKGKKRFRIDESLRNLIDILNSKRTAKEIIQKLGRARNISTANAFIYTQQLFEEGVVEILDSAADKSAKL